jgi:hypothetical protein
MVSHAVHMEVLGDGGWVVFHGVAEEEFTQLEELIQSLRAGPQELEHGEKPGVAFAQIRLVPHACSVEKRPQPSRQLVGRETEQVLLIEPVELVGIEDRIASADAAEVERGDQLVACEQFLIAGAG